MPTGNNLTYHTFIGRALYKTGEVYARVNLQTGGSTETSSLEFLCQLLNDSIQSGRRVILTRKTPPFRVKHPEQTPTIRSLLRACSESEMNGTRVVVNENQNTQRKPTSYEPLNPEQMQQLREIWQEKYSGLSRQDPFTYQPEK